VAGLGQPAADWLYRDINFDIARQRTTPERFNGDEKCPNADIGIGPNREQAWSRQLVDHDRIGWAVVSQRRI
jgi:hypothetical protein